MRCVILISHQLVWIYCVCVQRYLVLPSVCVCPRFYCATTCSEVYQSSPRATELITSSRTQRWRLSPRSFLHSVLPSVVVFSASLPLFISITSSFSGFTHYGSNGLFPLLLRAHTARSSLASRCAVDHYVFVPWVYFSYWLKRGHVRNQIVLEESIFTVVCVIHKSET